MTRSPAAVACVLGIIAVAAPVLAAAAETGAAPKSAPAAAPAVPAPAVPAPAAAAPAGAAQGGAAAKSAPAAPPAAAPGDLDKAVAAMRRVKPEDFSKEQQQAKGKELDAAWKTLIQAGPAGAARLKQELAKIDAATEKDDFFKLGAAVVLWQIGNLGEAQAIAAAWSGDVDPALNYNYVFYTAMDAARTQDPRALPMLTAVLRDHKGSVFREQHAMAVRWPLTHSFLWWAFGPKGLPALAQALAESSDAAAQKSAMFLLAQAQYLPALPRIRQLALQAGGDSSGQAVRALGLFGHPQDFDFLVKGLATQDPKAAFDFAFALYEYEDLRAAAHLVPLLASADEQLRGEAVSCLRYLLTPPGLEALQKHAAAPGAGESAKRAAAAVQKVLGALGLAWDAYAAKTPAEKEALLAGLRRRAEEKFVLKPDDRRLSHDELLKAAEEWMKNGRITGGTYEWVEDRHALAASTPEDIPLWLDVKAKVCLRISDECLYEAEIIDGLVRRLGRSRYRKEAGICGKVEPAGAVAPAVPGSKPVPAPKAAAPAARTPVKAPSR